MMRKSLTIAAAVVLAGAFAGGCAYATPQLFQYHQRLTGDALNDENFGRVVASGEWLIVRATHALVHDGRASGMAYVFRRDADERWQLTQRIPNPEPEFAGPFGGFFGVAAAIRGDRMLISGGNQFPDDGDNFNNGAAYLFELDHGTGRWELKQRLIAPETGSGSFFGSLIVLLDDYALIARPSADRFDGEDWGIIYVYEPDPDTGEWGPTQQWSVPGASGVTSMAADGDVLAVGKGHLAVDGVSNIGSVFIFERDAAGIYRHTATIEPDLAEAGEFGLRFGVTLALHDGTLLIGASGSVTDGVETGAAWLYRRNAPDDWEIAQRLAPVVQEVGLRAFGNRVSMSDSLLLMSSTYSVAVDPMPNGGADRRVVGLLYVFRRNDNGTVELKQVLAPPDSGIIGRGGFGTALHHDGSQLFIGAGAATVRGQALAGALYVLDPSDLPPADLAVEGEVVPTVVDGGDEAAWLVQVTNRSPDTTATGVRVFNPVQGGMAFIDGSPGCALDVLDGEDIVRCALGSIEPGATAEVSLTMRVDHPWAGGRNTNFTTVLAREPDPNTANNVTAHAVEVIMPAPPPEPEPEPPRRSGGGGLSWLTLLWLLAVVGLRSVAAIR